MAITNVSRYSKLFPGMTFDNKEETWVALYDQLERYYQGNGLYDRLNEANYYLNLPAENMKPLRNPASRSVEFYVSKLMPGTLPASVPIIAENEQIVDPIHKIWEWSNLNKIKPVASRWLCTLGDLFIHPVSNDTMTQVYLQFIKPQEVAEWKEDSRGNITSIRLDVLLGDNKWHIEIWDKFEQRVWEITNRPATKYLGTPQFIIPLSDYGIDFVPFVHVKFRDIGDKRGIGCFTHVLDKIDEANRMATRVHEIMFKYNKPYTVISANAVDSQGRPVPAPTLETWDTGQSNTSGKETMQVSDDVILYMPGMSKVEFLIPDLKYADFFLAIDKMVEEIEKDLPELSFYHLRESNLSGVAIRNSLGDAMDRAIEARANWESGLNRAENMALSIGTAMGLWNVGNYDRGEFAHTYDERDIFSASEMERAGEIKAKAEAIVASKAAGFTDVEALQQAI